MALGRYVVTKTTTAPAGTLATPTPGQPETGGPSGFGSSATTGGPLFATTFLAGTPLLLDTAGSLYASLNGAGALRAYVQGQDDVGHGQGLAN
jgi:hypothetical protein